MQHDPLLDPPVGLGPDSPVATDEYLEGLVPKFVKAALLAQEAGFDGVDIKACHRYLLSELLGAFERPGKYGGSFENRTRLLLEIVDAVKAAVRPDLIVACRLNVYDAHPYPSGFGVDKADFRKPDLAEPVKLAKLLAEHGVELLCVTAGNPYYSRPYVGRPFDAPVLGAAMPDEHPLEGCARLYALAAEIAAAVDIPVVGTGYSYLRQYLPYAGAANIAAGRARFHGPWTRELCLSRRAAGYTARRRHGRKKSLHQLQQVYADHARPWKNGLRRARRGAVRAHVQGISQGSGTARKFKRGLICT